MRGYYIFYILHIFIIFHQFIFSIYIYFFYSLWQYKTVTNVSSESNSIYTILFGPKRVSKSFLKTWTLNSCNEYFSLSNSNFSWSRFNRSSVTLTQLAECFPEYFNSHKTKKCQTLNLVTRAIGNEYALHQISILKWIYMYMF